MTLMIDLPEDRVQALGAKAQAKDVSTEEYVRQVLDHDLEQAQSISEMMREIWGDMPEDTRAKLARDGATQVDHYLYGLPKREA